MSTNVIPGQESTTKLVKVTYKVETFYAFCPSCGHSRQCRHEDDGSYSLICGCMRDGANAISYLISASEIRVRDEVRTKYLNVLYDYPPEAKEDQTIVY